MIDHDDADSFSIFGLIFNGWTGIIFTLIALIFLYIACQNDKECHQRTCSNGQKARLIDHTCGCLKEAKP